MRPHYYILDGHTPIPTNDMDEWEGLLVNAQARTVAKTSIGNIEISTVFLGLDHNFYDGGPPLLFETMIFGGHLDQYQERCSTWEEAEQQHAKALAAVKNSNKE